MVKITPLTTAIPSRKLGGASGLVQFISEDFNDEKDDFAPD